MSNSTVATTAEQKQEQELTSPMGGPSTSTSHPHSLPLHLSTSAVNATTPTPTTTPASEATEGTLSDGEVFAALHSLFRNNITLKDETAPTSDWDFNDVQLDETAVNADVVLEMFGMFTCFPKLPFEVCVKFLGELKPLSYSLWSVFRVQYTEAMHSRDIPFDS